ncbi:SMP-30/gluconolactonase/LRE family protein [Legionella longbeachae]|uniref:SMP-30/Gluconolactonase/LRE-like region domain-containing protein n=1 Tax=Legionella longbeachae serogroup 1 (strain NSW150) TaxID=661367 RepID=D3HJN9_LEGLN|nr:SMP-30/gluconolactonase/LRE family protein [Legionella longbeachae]VEE03167.1 Gluconolactonase precursor [Legionella oakridgensis]HBD7398969.1 SMP-30/gluconolactonase/LRE family protein [Legionella pneumophila]ARB93933.1 SMP-30/gluconolactonase/LRE family protein [Legionella longbeachae]ARM32929.1 SMP-30/gluconolactonase/LRE family protein [Legionella longbeachae]EEZ94252.1 SMP-30/Gluconolaconase/LRE domain protein [Legionella longbeachae D-4968]
MNTSNPTIALDSHALLGESPLWSPHEGVLYWLDCLQPAIHSFNPQTAANKSTILNQIVTSISLYSENSLLVTVEEGYAFANLLTGSLTLIGNPYAHQAVIFNDGKCDREGRFWSGTAAKDWQSPIGVLFQLSADLKFKPMDKGFILSNGIGFSPDNKYLYFSDSSAHTIYRYDFDLSSGAITNKKAFIIIPDSEGLPDGMTVDAQGNLWVAMWDGWSINRYDPQGKKIDSIKLPIPRPTSVAFGDRDLSTLYITSARIGLSEEQLKLSPLSGSLFAMQTSFKGLPEPYFKVNSKI